MSFTTVKNGLDEIAERSAANSKRVTQAKALLLQAQADLNAMASAYLDMVSEINSEAAANPSDVAWQGAKAEKDQLVSDFQALKSEVDALVTAVSA